MKKRSNILCLGPRHESIPPTGGYPTLPVRKIKRGSNPSEDFIEPHFNIDT